VPWLAAKPADRGELTSDPHSPVALVVGLLNPAKGQDLLLDALVEPGLERLHVALAGHGELEPALRARATRLGLDARVRFLGFRTDVPRLLAAADFLVLPSRWEGMPYAVLEAMASARCVVATPVDGARDLVEPGVTGELAAQISPRALAAALRAQLACSGRGTHGPGRRGARAAPGAPHGSGDGRGHRGRLPRGRVKILHVITTLDVGGAEMHLLSQVRGQTARGHAVHVAYLKGQGTLADDFRSAGAVSVERVGPLALPFRLRAFDLVHTHLLKADAAGAVAAIAAGRSARLVSSKHNDEQVLKKPLVSRVHGVIGNVPSRVIVLSDHVGRFVEEHGRVDRRRNPPRLLRPRSRAVRGRRAPCRTPRSRRRAPSSASARTTSCSPASRGSPRRRRTTCCCALSTARARRRARQAAPGRRRPVRRRARSAPKRSRATWAWARPASSPGSAATCRASWPRPTCS
jgi:glycosyltransferase involved in cell wall biosynthesis